MIEIGEVAVFQTDTIYGICANALSEAGVMRLFSAKMRDRTKPVGIFVGSIKELEKYCYIRKQYQQFLNNIWPGPITCVLPTKKNSRLKITPNKVQPKTVAVRIPEKQLILSLIEELGAPLIQTSVNITGQAHMLYSELINSYYRFADLMIDSGPEEHNEPSTVISLVGPQVELLRKGSTSWSDIKSHLEMAGVT